MPPNISVEKLGGAWFNWRRRFVLCPPVLLAFVESLLDRRRRRRSIKEGEFLDRINERRCLREGLTLQADFFSSSICIVTLTWKTPQQSRKACMAFSSGSASVLKNGSLIDGLYWE